MGEQSEQREIMSDLLRGAIPVNPAPHHYVTREELAQEVSRLESRLDIRLENATLKTRNWVLGGMIGSAILFGGGFITTIAKIDRLAETLPQLVKVQEGRREWIQRQDQRDSRQDDTLEKLDKNYHPIPYEPSPQ